MKLESKFGIAITITVVIMMILIIYIDYNQNLIKTEKEQMNNLVKQIIDFSIAVENIPHHEWTQMRVESIQDETRCSQLEFELVELHNLVKNKPDTYPEMFYYYWLTEQQNTKHCGELNPIPTCLWNYDMSRCDRSEDTLNVKWIDDRTAIVKIYSSWAIYGDCYEPKKVTTCVFKEMI